MNSYRKKQLKKIESLEENFKSGRSPSTIVEPVKNYITDNRICLTGVVFLPKNITDQIEEKIIKPLRNADKKQCFYLPKSLHVTIQNVRTIADPPLFNTQDIEKVKKVFEKIVPKYKSFEFELKGLFELPTSLGIRAFCGEILKEIAFEIRENLEREGVPDNKIYGSSDVVIGNSTFCRYTTKPNNDFFKKVYELKNMRIGKFEVKKISLITTNAICHPKKTKILSEYYLK